MAKNVHSNNIALSLSADWSFTAYGHTITAQDLAESPAAFLYILGHGWKASIGESQAISKEQFGKLVEKAKESGEDVPVLESLKAERAAKRAEDIKTGKLVAGQGSSRLTGIDAHIRDVGLEFATTYFTAKAAKEGKTLPAKSSKDWAALVEKFTNHPVQMERIKAEAERRMATAKEQDDTDLDLDF